jgi:hypothetical protein
MTTKWTNFRSTSVSSSCWRQRPTKANRACRQPAQNWSIEAITKHKPLIFGSATKHIESRESTVRTSAHFRSQLTFGGAPFDVVCCFTIDTSHCNRIFQMCVCSIYVCVCFLNLKNFQ